MFYSETLLAKNGPLARVWLASNLERKLSKQNVLNEKLETKVKDIIGTDQAPMALRMSGQLLLGVARIYGKKAKYLLDDCSEALIKIKMAFRPGNVDLPSNQSHTANPNTLILPDTITELDLFAPLPDPEDLLRDPESRGTGRDPTLLDFGASQLLPESQTPSRRERSRMFLEDDILGDLDIDIGLGPDVTDRSIEIGRRAHTPKPDRPSFLDGDDLGLDYGLGGDTTIGHDDTLKPLPVDNDTTMLDNGDEFAFGGNDDEVEALNEKALAHVDAAVERRQLGSDSPLSSIHGDFEETFRLDQEDVLEEDETHVQPNRAAKRRKVMTQDAQTELNNDQIRMQQKDTSAITKASSFLPRDPVLLQLMEMQRNGSFVSNIMGDGRMQGWAPELRGILSLELVRSSGQNKRKRDSGVADVETDGENQQTPRLELPEEEDEGFEAGGFGGDNTIANDGPLLMSDGLHAGDSQLDEDEQGYSGAPFDITEAPLLHPSQSGPVSLGTKNAVHMLREHFAPNHPKGSTEPPTPSKRVTSEAYFTDLCPEATTSRHDATRMFFEMLVLGTKDAIKVEQDSKEIGLPIRVRGKRGLWGDWAELEAGGEIAAQTNVEVEG
ncbi:Conserved region of Rad21 / Rec8 like protein [Acrodontium crateriforme]|uniref:Conserved region of Rad21 / Rec8 like protein n=1 Tax=Acrodontium crateriforme TaxID=150365 RepID=A0AAQ3R9N3_9PEZI|nr:Conserved region of Rad21 / Rec8 like protein [Acrodontium crateriforme]